MQFSMTKAATAPPQLPSLVPTTILQLAAFVAYPMVAETMPPIHMTHFLYVQPGPFDSPHVCWPYPLPTPHCSASTPPPSSSNLPHRIPQPPPHPMTLHTCGHPMGS